MQQGKKKNELEHLKQVYDFDNLSLLCFGVTKNKANSILQTLELFADKKNFATKVVGPDMVARYDNTAIGVEHFSYDASSKSRKGSAEKREIEREDNQFYAMAKEAAKKGKSATKMHRMRSVSNEDTFINNFLAGFRDHNEHLGEYRKNIEQAFNNGNVECWFLAEDCSSISPFFSCESLINGVHEYALLPIMYCEVRLELAKSNVDGFIFVSNFPISNQFVFVKNNKESLKTVSNYYGFSDSMPVQFNNGAIMGFSSTLLLEVEDGQ